MWPWKRKRQAGRREDRLDELASIVADLQSRLVELEAGETGRAVEWEDWFSKFSSLYARLNKRVQREEAKAADANGDLAAAPMSIGAARLLNLGRGP